MSDESETPVAADDAAPVVVEGEVTAVSGLEPLTIAEEASYEPVAILPASTLHTARHLVARAREETGYSQTAILAELDALLVTVLS